jgi:ElaB/YqjD/DUF883 family membrane-anchored ribosome-binding protein
MAPKDAEMPDHKALNEDIQEITKQLNKLRANVESVASSAARAGGHQVERAQDKASEALASVEDAVRRDPVKSLGIAVGIGFLIGIVLRR